MTDDDKDKAVLARGYPGTVFGTKSGYALEWTSTCSTAPRCRPLVTSRSETTRLRNALIANSTLKDDLAAIATGQSTLMEKEAVGIFADRIGRSASTVRAALKSTIGSSTAK